MVDRSGAGRIFGGSIKLVCKTADYASLIRPTRYLVTSLVDTVGRRKTYGLLLDVFKRIDFPKEMTVEDVHLGSPSDPFFQFVSGIVRVSDVVARFENCVFNDLPFDGVVYRSVRSPPSVKEAASIEKRFQMQVRKLVASA